MNKSHWQAQWIRGSFTQTQTPETQAQTTLQFRNVFDWEASAPTWLRISAGQIYRVYLNGAYIGRGPDRADPRALYYDEYDVTAFLRVGRNVICGLAHHFQPRPGMRDWCLYGGAPGLLAQIESSQRVWTATDSQWRVRLAPGWRACDVSISRFRPCRHEFDLAGASDLQAALQPEFDDTTWQAATTFDFAPAGLLPEPLPREIPFLTPETRYPRTISVTHPRSDTVSNPLHLVGRPCSSPTTIQPAPESVELTLHFERPMGGFFVLELEAEGTGVLDVYCGEGGSYLLTDRLRLAPVGGLVRYEPLDWRGGQNLRLSFQNLTAPVHLHNVQFIEHAYPFEPRGAFRCADDTLTQIWRICRTTAAAGVKDHLVDCLNREQALWPADVATHNRALMACFGDTRPGTKAVRQTLRNLAPSGAMPAPGPVGLGYNFDGPVLNWSEMSLAIPIALADILWFAPQKDLAEWALPALVRLMAHFAKYVNQDGLLSTQRPNLPSLKCFGGWNPMLKEGVTCAFNSEYILALRAAATVAQIAGDEAGATAWREQSDNIATAALARFWEPARNLFYDGEHNRQLMKQHSATANAWAALAGLLPSAHAGAWAEALRTAPDIMPPLTPFDATLLLEAYLKYELDLHARQLLDSYWGDIARHGHPTLPEYWHAGYRGGLQFRGISSSLCHPFGTGPAFLYMAHILGVQALTPGWTQVQIRPRDLGLAWAQGRVPTPQGAVAIAWEKQTDRWEIELSLPQNMQGKLTLPRRSWGRERLLVNHREVWSANAAKDYQDQLDRNYAGDSARTVNVKLTSGARQWIVLESY